MKRIFVALLVLVGPLLLAQEPQSEFVPVTQVPPGEQLPSAPLVIAAYAFVWLAFVAYAWTMWRKLGKVEQELSALSQQLAKRKP